MGGYCKGMVRLECVAMQLLSASDGVGSSAAGLIFTLPDERTLARGERAEAEGWLGTIHGLPQGGIAEVEPTCRLKSGDGRPIRQTTQARLYLVQDIVQIRHRVVHRVIGDTSPRALREHWRREGLCCQVSYGMGEGLILAVEFREIIQLVLGGAIRAPLGQEIGPVAGQESENLLPILRVRIQGRGHGL